MWLAGYVLVEEVLCCLGSRLDTSSIAADNVQGIYISASSHIVTYNECSCVRGAGDGESGWRISGACLMTIVSANSTGVERQVMMVQ